MISSGVLSASITYQLSVDGLVNISASNNRNDWAMGNFTRYYGSQRDSGGTFDDLLVLFPGKSDRFGNLQLADQDDFIYKPACQVNGHGSIFYSTF